MALFLGAVFPGRFTSRGIQQDYVVGMGGSAYDYLASTARANRHVFGELAAAFTRMLDMVANVCSREQALSTEEIIQLYRRWLDTREESVALQLRALGIDLSSGDRLQ